MILSENNEQKGHFYFQGRKSSLWAKWEIFSQKKLLDIALS